MRTPEPLAARPSGQDQPQPARPGHGGGRAGHRGDRGRARESYHVTKTVTRHSKGTHAVTTDWDQCPGVSCTGMRLEPHSVSIPTNGRAVCHGGCGRLGSTCASGPHSPFAPPPSQAPSPNGDVPMADAGASGAEAAAPANGDTGKKKKVRRARVCCRCNNTV
jgi:hypothetical protein